MKLVMQNAKHLTAVGFDGDVTERSKLASHRVMALWHTVIGKKIVMAATGVVLIAFLFGHMMGNLKMFSGPEEINAYARFLRNAGLPELGHGQVLWIVRIVLLVCVTLHITAAVQLTRMSHAARPVSYNVKRNIETTFAARMMRWGGVLLAVFVVFHLLHLTGGVVGFKAGQFRASRRLSKRGGGVPSLAGGIFYIVAMAALCLHLGHGIWSLLQTLGWSTVRNEAMLKTVSWIIAIVVFAGFSSIPVAVMAGWLH